MTLNNMAALFGVMVVGAAIPGLSVLAVSARSAAAGLMHGVFTTMGIVAGDIVFIIIAVYGLSLLADLLGNHFFLVKYLGGAYLIWLGIVIWRSRARSGGVDGNAGSSLTASFLTGLLITLGDQKAILFYLGFFPAFLDLQAVSLLDTSIIVSIAIVAVGGPKLVYAFLAHRAGKIYQNTKMNKGLNIAAGGIMIAVGGFIISTA